MTKNRSTKHAARERATASGKSYTAARRELLAETGSGEDTVISLVPSYTNSGCSLHYVETHGERHPGR